MNKDTGGQAFPNEGFNGWGQPEQGMTLRDYFAAKAMQGLIHHFDFATFRDDPMRLAAWSYDAADAMLAVRDGNETYKTNKLKAREQ